MSQRLVLVAGNIGAGKSSLTELLGPRLGWETAFESVIDNPYLADFYGDMRSWAFHLQIFFLGHRAAQHLELARSKRSAIVDRSIYEDAEIFASAALRLGTVTERDHATYRTVYELVVRQLPPPDLLLYLRAPVPVLLERIRARGREMEKGITPEYLELLDGLYETWVKTFDLSPVLTIPAADLDFVHRPRHLDIVVDRIQNVLAGKEEVEFPGR